MKLQGIAFYISIFLVHCLSERGQAKFLVPIDEEILRSSNNKPVSAYHVTRQMNLKSIQEEGLLPRYGGSPQKNGMSVSRGGAAFINPAFVIGSQGKVHLTTLWEAVCRYTHQMTLRTPPNKEEELGMFPVIIGCDTGKRVLEDDPHDQEGHYTQSPISSNALYILVTRKIEKKEEEPEYTEDKLPVHWLPLKKWDERHFTPAYVDKIEQNLETEKWKIIFNFMKHIIHPYKKKMLNKGKTAEFLNISRGTLNKVLNGQYTSLRKSTQEKIMNQLLKNLDVFKAYDP